MSSPGRVSHHQPTVPVHSGRGGAGNLVPSSSSGHTDNSDSIAAPEDISRPAPPPKSNPGTAAAPAAFSGGRGGAGNFAATSQQRREEEEQEHSRKTAEIEDKIKHVVEQGLKMPQKAHHAVERHKGPYETSAEHDYHHRKIETSQEPAAGPTPVRAKYR